MFRGVFEVLRGFMHAGIISRMEPRINPERAFVAAWLIDSIRAAQRGDQDAVTWCDRYVEGLAEALGMHCGNWRSLAPVPVISVKRAARGRRPRLTWAERKARKLQRGA